MALAVSIARSVVMVRITSVVRGPLALYNTID